MWSSLLQINAYNAWMTSSAQVLLKGTYQALHQKGTLIRIKPAFEA